MSRPPLTRAAAWNLDCLGVRGDEGEVEPAGRLSLDERQVLCVFRPQHHGGPPRLRRFWYVGHLGPQRLQSRPVELKGAREIGDLDDYVIDKGGGTRHELMVLLQRSRRQVSESKVYAALGRGARLEAGPAEGAPGKARSADAADVVGVSKPERHYSDRGKVRSIFGSVDILAESEQEGCPP